MKNIHDFNFFFESVKSITYFKKYFIGILNFLILCKILYVSQFFEERKESQIAF